MLHTLAAVTAEAMKTACNTATLINGFTGNLSAKLLYLCTSTCSYIRPCRPMIISKTQSVAHMADVLMKVLIGNQLDQQPCAIAEPDCHGTGSADILTLNAT